MGRPKKSAPVYVEPEEISQEVEEDEEEAVTEFNAEHAEPAVKGSISKAEAVRRALAAGHESPEAGVAYLKKHFGIEMNNQTFSSNKAQQKARDAKKAGTQPEAAPAAPRKQAAPAAPRQTAPATSASGGIIADLADIKRLLATHGKDGLEELIDVLS